MTTADDLRAEYQATAEDESADALDREVARQQLDRLAGTHQGTQNQERGPSRWRHVPLVELFEKAGNTVRQKSNGRAESSHEPHHGSKSGTCVFIDIGAGVWYCASCRRGGDAVTFVMDKHGCDYRSAAGWLIEHYGKPEGWDEALVFRQTDTGNALRFVHEHRDNVRYCHLFETWLIWDGARWVPDERGRIVELAKSTVRGLYTEVSKLAGRVGGAETETEGKRLAAEAAALLAWARRSESAGSLAAMVKLAQSDPAVVVSPDELDAHPWLLNVTNGTINLRTGQLQPHTRNDLLTKLAPVAYDPEAAAPTWLRFLGDIFAGSESLITYVQRGLGYSLAADISEHVLFLLYGTGSNGKSTLMETVSETLGDYSQQAEFSTFIERKSEGARNDLAKLKGARFVSASEAKAGARLDEVVIKQLTGGDRVTARYLFKEFFTFTPTHTLFLAANHRPEIRDTSFSIWRRVKLVPFSVTIERPDKALPEKLRAEAAGILAWLVRGCLGWQRHGLADAPEVADATSAYRADMDILGGFIAERCVLARGAQAAATDLYTAYTAYCTGTNEPPVTQTTFGRRLQERGLISRRDSATGRKRWLGIGLRDPSAPSPGSPEPPGGPNPEQSEQSEQFSEKSEDFPFAYREYRKNPSDCSDCSAETDSEPEIAGAASAYTLVAEQLALAEALPALLAAPALGFDTETTGLDPLTDQVRLVQLATPEHTYVIDCFRVPITELAPVFAGGRELVGHGVGFDLRFLAAVGIDTSDTRLFDTHLAAQLLGADWEKHKPPGYYGLAAVAERYLGEAVDKTEQKSDWSSEALTETQLAYAARDAGILPRLADVLRAALADAGLEKAAALEFATLPAIVAMEQAGAPFDTQAWKALSDAATRDRIRLDAELTAAIWPEELARFAPAPKTKKQRQNPPAFNWNSTPQVLALLRSRGHDISDVAAETLTAIKDKEPIAALRLQRQEAHKRETTYGIKWAAQHVHARTGRIHPNFKQIGSVAGRMACGDPNLQNIPKAAAYRACFRPVDGRALVKADYSQIELRIAAQLTRDPVMLAAYRTGEDIHVKTAAAVLGIEPAAVTKENRQLAKAVNFGLIYGMGAPRFQEHAASQYDVTVSLQEAAAFKQRFLQLYQGIRRWHRDQGNEAVDTRTLTGRRRSGIVQFTEKLNSPVQGTGADMVKDALVRLYQDRQRFPSACVVNVIHDEILVECDAGDAQAVAAWLTGHMEAAGAALLPDVPVVAEAEVMRDWSGTPV